MLSVYGLFKPSLTLEIGIKRLEEEGFSGERIAVVPMDLVRPGRQKLLDSMYGSDGMSLLDGLAVSASIGMLLGVIYGSKVFIGPVALGLAGAVAAGVIGLLLDLGIRKRKRAGPVVVSGEVIVAVSCASGGEARRAEEIMKEHRAAAMGRGRMI